LVASKKEVKKITFSPSPKKERKQRDEEEKKIRNYF